MVPLEFNYFTQCDVPFGRERGFFLIFNHERFKGEYSNNERKGTEHDVNKLRKIMQELGFTVRVYQDKRRSKDLV